MAREMYLVGVDEDELKPPEPPKQPKTPKGKWENFWYHYKWHTIAIAAAALVITVMVVQFVTQPRYDYQVILVTQKALAYGEDKVIAGGMLTATERSWSMWTRYLWAAPTRSPS